MSEYLSILFGAGIGAGLSFLATEWSAKRRLKEDRERTNASIRNEIIDNCLKYIFRYNDLINEIRGQRETLAVVQALDPSKAEVIEKKLAEIIESKMNQGIFVELMHITAQLMRIGNSAMRIDFEGLVELQRKMSDALLFPKDDTDIGSIEKEYKIKFQKFVEQCVDICKL